MPHRMNVESDVRRRLDRESSHGLNLSERYPTEIALIEEAPSRTMVGDEERVERARTYH